MVQSLNARVQVIAALIMDVERIREVQNGASRSGHNTGDIYVFVPVKKRAVADLGIPIGGGNIIKGGRQSQKRNKT